MAAGYGDGRVTIGQYLVGRVAVTDITAVANLPRAMVETKDHSHTVGLHHLGGPMDG